MRCGLTSTFRKSIIGRGRFRRNTGRCRRHTGRFSRNTEPNLMNAMGGIEGWRGLSALAFFAVRSWGVAPGWDGMGLGPTRRAPMAHGIPARAEGPRFFCAPVLGRCPRLGWDGPLATRRAPMAHGIPARVEGPRFFVLRSRGVAPGWDGMGLWPTRIPMHPWRFLHRLPVFRANGAPPSQPGATPQELSRK